MDILRICFTIRVPVLVLFTLSSVLIVYDYHKIVNENSIDVILKKEFYNAEEHLLSTVQSQTFMHFYGYSTYMLKENTSITFGVASIDINCQGITCMINYVKHGKWSSFLGTLQCEIEPEFPTKVLNLICTVELTDSKLKPMTVILIDEQGVNKEFQITSSPRKKGTSGLGVCVLPSDYEQRPNIVAEFIGYYQTIGFKDIIIYDSGPHAIILQLIKKTLETSILRGFLNSFLVIKWNLPYTDEATSQNLALKDCLFRITGNFRVVVGVTWFHYLIPPSDQSIMSMLQNEYFESGFGYISTAICCTDNVDDVSSKLSWPITLRKTHCCHSDDKLKVFLNPDMNKVPQMFHALPGFHFQVIGICGETCSNGYVYKPNTTLIKEFIGNKFLALWNGWMLYTL